MSPKDYIRLQWGEGGKPKDYIGLHGGGGQFGQTIAKAKNQRNPDFQY